MRVNCADCGRTLEFSGVRPSFCGYCGKPLRPSAAADATTPFEQPTTGPRTGEAGPDYSDLPPEVRGYRLLGLLGQGGIGTVYQAEQLASGRRVALKLISPQYAASATAVERFRQEGRLASLIAHPRCVFVLAADEDAGRPYIVMELMPGETLQELVERDGPLPQAEAVARILDVIDGLQEAHRLGVIHRDVKPSNCFVLPDGRVKVGDFGLAKSLVQSSSLTRTGTFLGTLLYAPPEQIKGEAIDVRTDVYSVCATLYFLLTGRAQYQGKDAAATLARTVPEPPPPLRAERRDLSPALEQVVLRGLGRQREERWRDLEELRQALLRYAPGQMRPAGFAVRLAALVLDCPWYFLAGFVLNLIAVQWWGQAAPGYLLPVLAMRLLQFVPLWFLEGWYGATPGKWLLRLRVCTPGGGDPPGLGRAALRILAFYALLCLPGDLIGLALVAQPEALGLALAMFVCQVLGIVALLVTMRARNGYRGLHELLSGTRIVRLPAREWQRPLKPRRPGPGVGPTADAGLPDRLGPFVVRGRLGEQDGAALLLGEDPVLGRSVWLRVVGPDDEHLPEARRLVSRATRLPWLTCGTQQGWFWDAFLAPAGWPLADLVERRAPLTWGETRPLLAQLCEELTAARADGTLPRTLDVAEVWLQANGRLQLLDAPLSGHADPTGDAPDEEELLRLVRAVAILALEGGPPAPGPRKRVRAPVPAAAARVLDRLVGGPRAFIGAEEVQRELAALQGQPTQVGRAQRVAHLGLLGVALAGPLLVLFSLRYFLLLMNVFTAQQGIALADRAEGALYREEGTPADQAAVQECSRQNLTAPDGTHWSMALGERRRQLREELRSWEESAGPDLVAVAVARANLPQDQEAGPLTVTRIRHLVDETPERRKQVRGIMGLIMCLTPAAVVLGGVLWAFLFRGGLTLRLMGIALRRRDGRPAARWRCAWRTLLFWLPITVPLCLSMVALTPGPEFAGVALALWVVAAGLLAGYVPLALTRPTQSLHDRLAGTYLMPG